MSKTDDFLEWIQDHPGISSLVVGFGLNPALGIGVYAGTKMSSQKQRRELEEEYNERIAQYHQLIIVLDQRIRQLESKKLRTADEQKDYMNCKRLLLETQKELQRYKEQYGELE